MNPGQPRIRKVARVHGKGIVLRNVELEDAAFILSLRLDPRRSRHVSPVDPDEEKQRAWIRQYQQSDDQAYFVICDKAGTPLGTVRIYDAAGDSFSWGSWIMKAGAPASAAIESAVLVYRLATTCWGFRSAHFEVQRANASVVAFHEKFGAVRVSESADAIGFSIGAREIERSLQRYSRHLPGHLTIE